MIRDYREHFRGLSEKMAGKPAATAFPQFLAEIVKVVEDIDKRIHKMENKKKPEKGWGSGGFGKPS